MSDDSERTVFSPRPNARIGTRLNGIYEIESLIAVGGMGEVYKGRAIQTGDAVAIKMIRPDMARDEAVIALFRREAAALHNLYNEAIVRYYVFAIDPVSESPYLAMEFVDGQPLSERIKQQPLTIEEADVLRQRVGPGLHAAHRLGIVHRDISPGRMMLSGEMSRWMMPSRCAACRPGATRWRRMSASSIVSGRSLMRSESGWPSTNSIAR